MRYVFQIHSPITIAGAEKYIKERAINHDDCVFLYWRVPFDLNIGEKHLYVDADQNKSYLDLLSFNILDFNSYKTNQQEVKGFYTWLNSVIKEDFIYFTPHLQTIKDKMIVHHSRCKGYYFLEEGLGSYKKNIYTNSSKKNSSAIYIKNKIKEYLLFKKDIEFEKTLFEIHKKYKGVICYSKDSFKGYPARIEIGLPFQKIDNLDPIEHVLIVDNFLLPGLVDIDSYFFTLEKLLNFICANKSAKKIYFKVHPIFSKTHKQMLKIDTLFLKFEEKNKIEFEELHHTIEDVAVTLKKKVNFYGAYSAAMYYAHLAGANTHFSTQSLAEVDDLFKSFLETKFPKKYIELSKQRSIETDAMN